MEGDIPTDSTGRPMSAKRQKILEMAMMQLRKSRAAMDPKLLSKIRRLVASSPDIMKKLGLTEKLEPEEDMPLSSKSVQKPVSVAAKPVKTVNDSYETVDQVKNMEVMAKLMALNPKGRDKIKSAIKKAVD